MDFAQFRDFRETIKQEQPDVLDLAETNHVRALEPWLPTIEVGEHLPRAHRCHIADDWLALFDLPAEWKSRLCISRGVRHSLSLLLPVLAELGYQLVLPNDVYPVYQVLANEAQIPTSFFPTLPIPQFPQFPATASGQAQALLLTNPLKPLGRYLTGEEVEGLQSWLKEDGRRRLIIDAVYTFDTKLHPSTLRLFSGEQTIVLHSLSKGWAAPQITGVALFPDADAFRPIFRDASPTQPELQKGQLLMREHRDLPHRLFEVLERKQEWTKEELVGRGINVDSFGCPGYLTMVALPWEDMLHRLNVLAIPASAFGSSRNDLSIISTLGAKAKSLGAGKRVA